MKKSTLALAFAALLLGVCADSVTPEMARLAANAWAARNAAFGAGTSATAVRAEYDPTNATAVLWYQVSMTGGGCLMIAPDTTIEPVVVALDNDPGVLPEQHPLRGILTGDMRSRLALLAKAAPAAGSGMTLMAAAPIDDAAFVAQEWGDQQKSKWAKLGVGSGGRLQDAATVGVKDPIALEIGIVDGFEKGGRFTHWNQSAAGGRKCFNYYTPGNVVCGCVATATGAIMQFFGVRQYTLAEGAAEPGADCAYNGAKYKAEIQDPDEPFDWTILPKNWGGEAAESDTLTEDQAKLLGRLAYNAGVCHDMKWSDRASGAFTADMAKVLRNYFGFTEARRVRSPKQDDFRKLIYMQCWSGAPVGMGIEGHAVVAVGYGKDAEGVDRVRVFMGWGGAGDGWYALPYIDTKATMNGGTYLSEVVNSITTMISLEDDKVVPVCGTLIPTINAPVMVDGETKNANAKGYFGIRISAATATKGRTLDIECQGKTVTQTVPGEDPKKGTMKNDFAESGADLAKWIPEAIVLPLVNIEAATTFDGAKAQALRTTPVKPVLAFSGTWGEETTDAAWAVIQEMDANNTDDFTNKFVLLCMPYAPGDQVSDGNPSISLFDPEVLESDDRWAFYNGRIAYWSVYGRQYTADDALKAELYNPTNKAANRYISAEEITAGVTSVLGAEEIFDLAQAAISVTSVTGTPGTEDTNYCFTAVNEFRPGEVTFTAPEIITNAANTIVYACAGWVVSNRTAEVATGTDAVAQFEVEAENSYQIVWQWTPVLYRLTVLPKNSHWGDFPSSYSGLVSVSEKWMAEGESVQIVAEPDCLIAEKSNFRGAFEKWDYNDQTYANWVISPKAYDGVADAKEDGPMVMFTMGVSPVTIHARYSQVTCIAGDGKCLFAVASRGNNGFDTPVTAWGTNEYVEGQTYEMADGGYALHLKDRAIRATDADGGEWICTNWTLTVKGVTTAGSNASGDASVTLKAGTASAPALNTLTWVWTKYEASAVQTEYVIDWNPSLDNLSSDYTTNLVSSAGLTAAGMTKDDLVVTAPRGWTAVLEDDGVNVTAKLVADEVALATSMSTASMTIAPNGDGTLTVKAEVPDGIRGFWYSIYGADDLSGVWSVVAEGGYVVGGGEPTKQAVGAGGGGAGPLTVKIVVAPASARQFYRAVVTEKDPTTDP